MGQGYTQKHFTQTSYRSYHYALHIHDNLKHLPINGRGHEHKVRSKQFLHQW